MLSQDSFERCDVHNIEPNQAGETVWAALPIYLVGWKTMFDLQMTPATTRAFPSQQQPAGSTQHIAVGSSNASNFASLQPAWSWL
jgi:hypothetical protein